MAVLLVGADVELLAAARAVAMADEADLLERGEGAIDRGRHDLGVVPAQLLDELGAGDVALDPRQGLDHGLPLRGPALSARPQLAGHRGPPGGK